MSTTDLTPRSLSIREACERMGCGWKFVYELIQTGVLPAYRLTKNGRYRIEEDDLERYIDSRRYRPKGGGS
jgi:excisionase family DNA binding protein